MLASRRWRCCSCLWLLDNAKIDQGFANENRSIAEILHFLQMLRRIFLKLTNLMVVGRDSYDADDILTYFVQQIV
jgi:hypothetical protein